METGGKGGIGRRAAAVGRTSPRVISEPRSLARRVYSYRRGICIFKRGLESGRSRSPRNFARNPPHLVESVRLSRGLSETMMLDISRNFRHRDTIFFICAYTCFNFLFV